MTTPRLEIRSSAIAHNARTLVQRLGVRGIGVTGVTKATLGHPGIARTLIDAGVDGLGDSRIENLERLRAARVGTALTLLRSPALSQVDRVVRTADVSFNTELEVVTALSAAAGRHEVVHRVVLMVELGDLREGVLSADLVPLAREVLRLPHLALAGIGTNLACRSGIVPDATTMAELSGLAGALEAELGVELAVVSGGNSANLGWALGGGPVGRVDDLRLGEAILLGVDPLHRRPIPDLRTDAFTLVAEVIESKTKPSLPWGRSAQAAFGTPSPPRDRGPVAQSILALGEQDVTPLGLTPPPGVVVAAASSDHLVVTSPRLLPIGAELRFGLDYGALLRAMTSPTVVGRAVELTGDPAGWSGRTAW